MPRGRGRPMCSIEGCQHRHKAKGYCYKHYVNFKRTGDPLTMKRAPNGAGHWDVTNGYRLIYKNGEQRPEHVWIAEKALGRRLPDLAVVHHVNGNKLDNRTKNLVICPNQSYHMLIHFRQRQMEGKKMRGCVGEEAFN